MDGIVLILDRLGRSLAETETRLLQAEKQLAQALKDCERLQDELEGLQTKIKKRAPAPKE